MLRELSNVSQHAGHPIRRWFTDDSCDLIIFFNSDHQPIGFHFCYRKHTREKILAYSEVTGFRYGAIDDGEGRIGKMKASPIMVCNGVFNEVEIVETIRRSRSVLEPELAEYILDKVSSYKQSLQFPSSKE